MMTPSIAPSGPGQPCSPGVPLASMAELGRRLEGRRSRPPAGPGLSKTYPSSNAGGLSELARRLARAYRSANARGLDRSEIAISQSRLIEQWQAVQSAVADAALKSAHEIPGIRLEPEFVEALASLRTKRVAIYGTKPSLFEDTEALSWAIQNYAMELRRPHDKRRRLAAAMARVSEAENPADPSPKDEVLRARRELFKAKGGVSRPALIECERRLNQARELMVVARDGIERDFHITKVGPIEPDPFGAFSADGGGQRQSDSNRRELKPRSSKRPGH